MDDPLDRAYLEWLTAQVGTMATNPRSTYHEFLHQLFTKEFQFTIPNDENRVDDGLQLRQRFVDEQGYRHVDDGWWQMGCSFLEVMIGLSARLSFQAEGEPSEWFWHLADVIGAHPCTDANYRRSPVQLRRRVNAIMDKIIWRQYQQNGRGGFFPLDHAKMDQRFVEIWYQMHEYLLERYS